MFVTYKHCSIKFLLPNNGKEEIVSLYLLTLQQLQSEFITSCGFRMAYAIPFYVVKLQKNAATSANHKLLLHTFLFIK